MSLLKKPLLIVTAILALAAFAAPSASAELWYDDSTEEALPGEANQTAVSGGGEIEIHGYYYYNAPVTTCNIPSISGGVWNHRDPETGELTVAEGELSTVQFSECEFRSEAYFWAPCQGTVTADGPLKISSLGGGELRLDVNLILDGTKCYWWGSKPQTLSGSFVGEWDNEQQTLSWNYAEVTPPGGGQVLRVIEGGINLDAESEFVGPTLK